MCVGIWLIDVSYIIYMYMYMLMSVLLCRYESHWSGCTLWTHVYGFVSFRNYLVWPQVHGSTFATLYMSHAQ